MRLRFPAVLLAFGLLLTTPVHAIIVQGFEHSALGSAVLSSQPSPNGSPSSLVITNLGSSGLDGVSMELPRSSGAHLVFGAHLNGTKIIHRDMALRVVGGTSPIMRSIAHVTINGCNFSVQSPYATQMTAEVWNTSTGQCVFSRSLPTSTIITIFGTDDAATPGSSATGYTAKTGKSGATKRCAMQENLAELHDISVDGVTVTGDMLVCEIESQTLPALTGSCVVRCACAPGFTATQAILECSGIKDPPLQAPQYAHEAVLAQLGDGVVAVTDDVEGSISYSCAGGGGGGAGGFRIGLNGLPQECRFACAA